MVVTQLQNIKSPPIFYDLNSYIDNINLYLKLEGLNIAGSIKLKAASGIIDCLEIRGLLTKDKTLIESSSGNLGIALSMICKQKGYSFVCVTDPNILPGKEKIIKSYGAKIVKVTQKDASGGYLGSRIDYIKKLVKNNNNYIWTNQYANRANVYAHYWGTGKEISDEFEKLDYLFVGAGTTGTLMGCSIYFKMFSPNTKIIAVDSVGSVTFDKPPGLRLIPGLGTSRKPELINKKMADEVMSISEHETIATCNTILDDKGLLLGGSTGTVLTAVKKRSKTMKKNSIVVAISPDFGHEYINTIYSKTWVNKYFPKLLLGGIHG